MSAQGSLLSVNVGMPRDVAWEGRTVHTGIWKSPVPGPRMARRLNLDGDGQGDLAGHGGENRAVMVYQRGSYEHWREFLGRASCTCRNRMAWEIRAATIGRAHRWRPQDRAAAQTCRLRSP